MYKNYFILNRFIKEAGNLLKDFKLVSAFSQEKNKIILELREINTSLFLEISVNPGFPYITLKDTFHRAKKNTIDFFIEYSPSPLLKIEIADFDRIVRLRFKDFSIYFAIRGKYTNLHLIDNDEKIISFKSEDEAIENNFLDEIKNTKFIFEENHLDILRTTTEMSFDEMIKSYPILGKEIILEAKRRFDDEKDESNKIISRVIMEIFQEKIAIFQDKASAELYLGPQSFRIFPYEEKKIFDKLTDAQNYYIGRKYFSDDFGKRKRIIEKYLNRELEKITSKINRLKAVLQKASKEEEYNRIGNILLINIHNIRKGMKSVQLEDVYKSNDLVNIKLYENKSPKQNADNYFNKSKSERISREKNKELLKLTETDFKKYINIEERFNKSETPEELKNIMKELKIKDTEGKKHNDDIKIKFKHYIIDRKYNVYVGKDSRNNDLLTTKFAKQNDYWFHARSVPGSHVVLRVENTKEHVPKNVLKSAASVAAFHSKAKTAGLAPVSYSLKKYVVKKKGMEAGKVVLMKEEVLLVHPEIPKNCEYQSEE
jgi:predicted ribosome quality control (RQC) complex YloA/Tae2 family protein